MNKDKKQNNGSIAVSKNLSQVIFSESYVIQLSEYAVNELYKKSYVQPSEVKGNWRNMIDVTDKNADALIIWTKVFIRRMDIDHSTAVNPMFYAALVNKIADHLSGFFIRFPESKPRKEVKKELKGVLFHNFDYVQNMCFKKNKQQLNKSGNIDAAVGEFNSIKRRKRFTRTKSK